MRAGHLCVRAVHRCLCARHGSVCAWPSTRCRRAAVCGGCFWGSCRWRVTDLQVTALKRELRGAAKAVSHLLWRRIENAVAENC